MVSGALTSLAVLPSIITYQPSQHVRSLHLETGWKGLRGGLGRVVLPNIAHTGCCYRQERRANCVQGWRKRTPCGKRAPRKKFLLCHAPTTFRDESSANTCNEKVSHCTYYDDRRGRGRSARQDELSTLGMVAVMAAVMLTSRRSSDDGHEREKKPSGSAGCFAETKSELRGV